MSRLLQTRANLSYLTWQSVREQFLMPPPSSASGLLAATRWSDPLQAQPQKYVPDMLPGGSIGLSGSSSSSEVAMVLMALW